LVLASYCTATSVVLLKFCHNTYYVMRYVHDHICINTDFFTISVVIHEIISDCHKVLVFHTDGHSFQVELYVGIGSYTV